MNKAHCWKYVPGFVSPRQDMIQCSFKFNTPLSSHAGSLPRLTNDVNHYSLFKFWHHVHPMVDSTPPCNPFMISTVNTQYAYHIAVVRARTKITYHFGISASGHLRPILIRKIREIASYSCGFAQSDRPNLTQIWAPNLPGYFYASPNQISYCRPSRRYLANSTVSTPTNQKPDDAD